MELGRCSNILDLVSHIHVLNSNQDSAIFLVFIG